MRNEAADINYISEKLKTGGYKLTKQRYEIINVMQKNNVHMNADEIYKKVKRKKIGLSTVYRILMILESVGAVKRINAANISYYELQNDEEIDIHVKCVKCNKVVDIRREKLGEDLVELIKNINESHGIIVNSTSIVLAGTCNKCETEARYSKSIDFK